MNILCIFALHILCNVNYAIAFIPTLFLTSNQFALLKSVAKEGVVKEPMAAEFLKKHRLPGASSVRTALEALAEGELLYRQIDGYIVYDRFLALWLRRL